MGVAALAAREQDVVLQALQFWCTVAEEELDCQWGGDGWTELQAYIYSWVWVGAGATGWREGCGLAELLQ